MAGPSPTPPDATALSAQPEPGRSSLYGLLVLTGINLFYYIDRYVVAAVAESLAEPVEAGGLGLSDRELGLLMTGFLIIFMVISPFFGWLGDRRPRKKLIAMGIAIWSLATALGGLAWNFLSLFLFRTAVGIGEAAYGTIAPAMLADYYPQRLRGRIFAVFFMATPVGSALGYILGGLVGAEWGWRSAFFVAGVPGLVLAALALTIKEPLRGQYDPPKPPRSATGVWQVYRSLLRNRTYSLSVLGFAAYTFGLGGLAFWMPAFLERMRGFSKADATVQFGAIIVVTGFVGTFAGGWLGDWLLKKTKQAYLWVSGLATLASLPFLYLALTVQDHSLLMANLVVAEVLLFMSTGPLNSAIVGCVRPEIRSTAVGMSILVMHLLGDVPSPPLIGHISDQSDLATAVLIVPFSIAVCGLFWCAGAIFGQPDPPDDG